MVQDPHRVQGSWFKVNGDDWFIVNGSKFTNIGSWFKVNGDDWFIVNGSKFMVIHYGREKDLL